MLACFVCKHYLDNVDIHVCFTEENSLCCNSFLFRLLLQGLDLGAFHGFNKRTQKYATHHGELRRPGNNENKSAPSLADP